MDIGLTELLLVVVPVWGLTAFVCYWIIRLAVRHGTLDAYRIDRVDQPIAEMSAAMARRQATYGGSDPEGARPG